MSESNVQDELYDINSAETLVRSLYTLTYIKSSILVTMKLVNSEIPQLDELSIKNTYISGTRVKYQCTYYTENTIVTPSSNTNLIEIFSSSDSIIPYLFPESTNSEFYCYHIVKYGERVLSCQYEDGDKATPVLPFTHLSSAGYLIPPGFLEVDSKNRQYFEKHYENFKEKVFESVEVTAPGLLCEKLDKLQKPLYLSKFANTRTHIEKAYQFANGVLGMFIIPLIYYLDRYLAWGALRGTSGTGWSYHNIWSFSLSSLMTFFFCLINLLMATSRYWDIELSIVLHIILFILSLLMFIFLSIQGCPEDKQHECIACTITNGAFVLWANRVIMFICSTLGDSKNIYPYSIPYFTYLIVSPKAAGARVTDSSGFPVHLYFLVISSGLLGVLAIIKIINESFKVGKTQETSLVRFITGVWVVGTMMFEVALWNAHGTKLYQLDESSLNQVYLCWTQLCIIIGLVMNILIREYNWASSLYDRLQETFSDVTKACYTTCSLLFGKRNNESTDAAEIADALGFVKL